jgi:drug/metabolite transporter (DMT)-like permease
MKWYIISIFLSLFYTFYVLLSKCLMKQFNIRPEIIFVNAIIIAALLCILFRRKDIIVPQPNVQYGLILMIAIILFYREYFIQLGTNNITNMGIIDGLAICIYLPLMTLSLYVFFGETISMRKIIGMILTCVAGYFLLYEP